MRASAVRSGRSIGRLLPALALGLLLAGCEACGACARVEPPHTPYFAEVEQPSEGARPGPRLDATRVAADPDAPALDELLVRTGDGRLHLGRWEDGSWRFEAVADDVVDDAIALDRQGADLFTAHLAPPSAPPTEDRVPVTGAHPRAPYRTRPGEGDLVVLRHRAGEPPHRTVAARRAAAPALRADLAGAVHLAFVQPAGREGWALVYLRVTPEGIVRRELGPALGRHPPTLVLEDERPVVAWVAPGPEVRVARWAEGEAFDVATLPRRMLGEPRVPPSALHILPGDPSLVAWVRPLPGGELEPVRHPVAYPPGTSPGAHLLMVASLEHDAPRDRALAAAPLTAGPAAVYLSRTGTAVRLAAAVHGLPVQAEREPDGWRVWVPVPGHARDVAGAGEQAVFATDTGLWFTTFWAGADAPARAEGVAPAVGAPDRATARAP